MALGSIALCAHALAPNASARPLDVVKMKSALKALGFYDAPEWGVTPYPDAALFDAIKTFQQAAGIKADGVVKPDGETEAMLSRALNPRAARTALQETAQALQAMGRGGDEILAHITPEEAALLHTVTDGGSINPQTGLMEFWGGWDRDDNGNAYDNDAQHGDTDASAAEASDAQARENDRQFGGRERDREERSVQDRNRDSQGSVISEDEGIGSSVSPKQSGKTGSKVGKSKAAYYQAPQKNTLGQDGFALVEPDDDLDAQDGYTDPAAANDDQAAENEYQETVALRPNKQDLAGYGDMSVVDHVNREREKRISNLTPKGVSSKGSILKIDITTAEEKALLQKAKSLGINSGLIDLKNPFDRAFIESYYGFNGKTEDEKDIAIENHQELNRRAQKNKRYKEMHKQFQKTLGNYGRPGWGGYGLMSQEELQRARNYSVGFGVPSAAITAFGKPSPALGFLSNAYYANAELNKRRKSD